MSAPSLGRIGIWSAELRHCDAGEIAEAAAELDELGFGALWIPGEASGDLLGHIDLLLNATKRSAIATGILNIWKHDAQDVGAWWRRLPADQSERFLLGLGVSHGALIGDAYDRPLTAMKDYLARLTAEHVSADKMCLAALGPKMLELARDKTAGAHPYLITPEHTATAREALGPGPLLAPMQFVILEADPARARSRKALCQRLWPAHQLCQQLAAAGVLRRRYRQLQRPVDRCSVRLGQCRQDR